MRIDNKSSYKTMLIGRNSSYEISNDHEFMTNHRMHLGINTITKETVVVKIMDKTDMRTKREIQFFDDIEKEERKCDYIIKLLDKFEYEENIIMVFPYYKNGDLFDYFKRKDTLPEHEIKRILYYVITAITYIHKIGYLYRDLKLENILMDDSMNPILIDFDMAIRMDYLLDLNKSTLNGYVRYIDGVKCGTIDCMAPETILSNIYGQFTDVWGIGCIAHMLYTGYRVIPEYYNIKTHKYIKTFDKERVEKSKYDTQRKTKFPSEEFVNLLSKIFTKDDTRIRMEDLLQHQWFKKIRTKRGREDDVVSERTRSKSF
jgi:serine/threonine protein kinase